MTMLRDDWNTLYLWLCSAFPNFKLDKAAASIWSMELPCMKAETVISAIRNLQMDKPSPFPPSIFEIVAALNPTRVSPKNSAVIAFQDVWKGRGTDDPIASQTLRLIGGGYGMAFTSDMAWHERRFVEIYCGLVEKEQRAKRVALMAPANNAMLTDGGNDE